ncbi:MAG: hypothetical protein HC771_22330, partial [Synechococcales cyanobacterium CRU_2_2]|nr:hypothetical protein [Synechococcales cyanobacterium CRU_2_2]
MVSEWQECDGGGPSPLQGLDATAAAAEELGLEVKRLQKLRTELLKPLKHWRCINPTAAPM